MVNARIKEYVQQILKKIEFWEQVLKYSNHSVARKKAKFELEWEKWKLQFVDVEKYK